MNFFRSKGKDRWGRGGRDADFKCNSYIYYMWSLFWYKACSACRWHGNWNMILSLPDSLAASWYLTLITLLSSSSTAGRKICIRPSAKAPWLLSAEVLPSFSNASAISAIFGITRRKWSAVNYKFGTSLFFRFQSFVERFTILRTYLWTLFAFLAKAKNMACLSFLRRNAGLGLQVRN